MVEYFSLHLMGIDLMQWLCLSAVCMSRPGCVGSGVCVFGGAVLTAISIALVYYIYLTLSLSVSLSLSQTLPLISHIYKD